MAAVILRYCKSTSLKTTLSHGDGTPARAVNPLREIRKQPDSWSKLGSKAAQSAHNKFNLLIWVSDGIMHFRRSLSAL